MEKLNLNGRTFEACKIDLYGSKLMLIKGGKGFLACGYINLQTAEKLGHAAAIVRGVASFDDMLNANVCELSEEAKKLGLKTGISGREALEILA